LTIANWRFPLVGLAERLDNLLDLKDEGCAVGI
jgi:hypothetical protein